MVDPCCRIFSTKSRLPYIWVSTYASLATSKRRPAEGGGGPKTHWFLSSIPQHRIFLYGCFLIGFQRTRWVYLFRTKTGDLDSHTTKNVPAPKTRWCQKYETSRLFGVIDRDIASTKKRFVLVFILKIALVKKQKCLSVQNK